MYNSSEMVFGAFLRAYFGVICLIAIAVAVLTLVANWKVYKKAGRPGWKCLIPIYNVYVLYDMVWETKQFWIYVALMVGYYLCTILSVGSSAFFAFIAFVFGIAVFVWSVRLMNHLSVCFGYGTGFTVGLLLLNTIFIMILAFGDSVYCRQAPSGNILNDSESSDNE